MLKELIDALAKQAVAAAGPQVKETDPTKYYTVLDPNGSVRIVDGKPPWRKHKASDLETLAAFSDRFGKSSIWYSRHGIRLLIDDTDRRECVSVEMLWSDQIRQLMDLEKSKPLIGHRPLLLMLRTVFTQSAFGTAPQLIETLRKVTFEANAKAEGNVQRGKSSVGKELNAAASFLGEVPEQVTLSVPIFHNSFARKPQDVICALEIFEVEQQFKLFPLPGEVEKAFAAAESVICQSILDLACKDSNGQVYYGVP